MSDERIEANLAAYIDGVLSREERASIERLLAENPRHRRMVQEMQRAQGLLATLPRVKAPADLADGVDPTLERSALLGEDGSDQSFLSRLMAPQVLALAATLVLLLSLLATAIYLLPHDGGTQLAGGPEASTNDQPDSEAATETEDDQQPMTMSSQDDNEPPGPPIISPLLTDVPDGAADQSPQTDISGQTTMVAPDGGQPQPATGDSVPPEEPTRGLVDRAVAMAGDALVLRAEVDSLPDASGVVAQFLTAAQLPISAQRVRMSDLPEDLRASLGDMGGDEVQLYVVESLPQEQARALLENLAGVGRPLMIAAAAGEAGEDPAPEDDPVAAPGTRPRIDVEQQRQALRIFPGDKLSFVIARSGEIPDEPTPGIPLLGATTHFRLEVSDDGYIDLAPVGLGRTDVLGQDLATLTETIRTRLEDDYNIASTVSVFHTERAEIPSGRTDQELEYLVVDREPVTPGTLLRITLPNGMVIDTVVGPDGKAQTAVAGEIDTTGRSVTDLQRALRDLASGAATRPAGTGDTPPIPRPLTPDEPELSLMNLSVRRNIEEVGSEQRPLLIILTPDEGAAGDWEGVSFDPATTTAPATPPSTAPATAPTTLPAR